jgi:hypothetical protein
MKHAVPFYANTPDDTHCYQAALRSVLKYFLPNNEYHWEELEEMTAKKANLWTWPTQGLITLHKIGFDIIDISDFDIEQFINTGEEYLLQEYGKEVADEQVKHSDIQQERALYKEFIQHIKFQKRIPKIEDLEYFVEKGYLIICNVNSKALNNQQGYVGHFVVIIGYDDNHLYLHDPGLPPLQDRKVTYEHFMKAWEYPNEKARNLTAVKYSTTSH